MYKIGIIGRRDAVQGFMALGFAVREADSTADAARELHAMAKYRDLPIPAIVSIPGQEGSMGYGMNNLRRAVERAVGADILFKDTN